MDPQCVDLKKIIKSELFPVKQIDRPLEKGDNVHVGLSIALIEPKARQCFHCSDG
jgi:hypothetical protein